MLSCDGNWEAVGAALWRTALSASQGFVEPGPPHVLPSAGCFFCFVLFFLEDQGLNSELHACKAGAGHTPSVHLALVILEQVSRTVHPGWPRTVIFLISASQVARTTGVSSQCLAPSVGVV
jgi:hypothetical protein